MTCLCRGFSGCTAQTPLEKLVAWSSAAGRVNKGGPCTPTAAFVSTVHLVDSSLCSATSLFHPSSSFFPQRRAPFNTDIDIAIRPNMATGVDARLLKSTKFPPEFSQKVDMQKVNLQVMKK